MLSSLSSNVILAKARAMYGKRLKTKDYQALLGCGTVGEVAAYLKQNTVYRDILTGVNEHNVHRGQLETLLRQKFFYDASSICRYELSSGEHFAAYLIQSLEIEQIMHSLMLLSLGRPKDYLFAMPVFLEKHTQINLSALADMRNFDDFLAAVAHSPYRKLLEPFRPHDGEPVNLTVLENALYTYLYRNSFQIIEQHTKGRTKAEVREIFNDYLDLTNYSRIVRLKQYYHAEPDYIRSLLLPFGTFSQEQINAMLAAPNVRQVNAVFRSLPLGKRIAQMEYNYADELPMRMLYKEGRHDIRFSVHPPVVMLSYIFLKSVMLDLFCLKLLMNLVLYTLNFL